jgi:hypothetical protein
MKGWNADESRDQKMAVERETRSNAKSQHYGHVDCISHCEGQRRITCYEARRIDSVSSASGVLAPKTQMFTAIHPPIRTEVLEETFRRHVRPRVKDVRKA